MNTLKNKKTCRYCGFVANRKQKIQKDTIKCRNIAFKIYVLTGERLLLKKSSLYLCKWEKNYKLGTFSKLTDDTIEKYRKIEISTDQPENTNYILKNLKTIAINNKCRYKFSIFILLSALFIFQLILYIVSKNSVKFPVLLFSEDLLPTFNNIKNKNLEQVLSFTGLEYWLPSWIRKKSIYFFQDIYIPLNISRFNFNEYLNLRIIDSKEFGNEINNNFGEIIACNIIILTAGDTSFNTLPELVENRIEYARRNGYCYLHFSCRKNNFSPDENQQNIDNCKYPHYWRYLALWELFTKPYLLLSEKRKIIQPQWVLYMDMDAMFTNFSYKIEKFARNFSFSKTGLIISADTKCYDPRYPLNNGVMLFRNNEFSQYLVYQVLLKQSYRSSLFYNGINNWNAKGLQDQPLLTNILVNDTNEIDAEHITSICSFAYLQNLDINGAIFVGNHVTILASREMNAIRRSIVHFRKDNAKWRWRQGDWIAHLSGLTPMAPALRQKYIKEICNLTPVHICPFNITLNATELIIEENKLSLLRYKKELREKSKIVPKK
ncbi:hypothetical protein cand_018440 [Cryptosporidium andersoni]|uniref:Nucleotide-diphospho-sugar transferase domain-containing protein n=1 Tax=Cryptosporidium andersoni TaxID=117008 RepID=A0A1J4MDQ1_9CRYT|nr:hypothetical protein cand_018440 [Cryptosporidium andersoni]